MNTSGTLNNKSPSNDFLYYMIDHFRDVGYGIKKYPHGFKLLKSFSAGSLFFLVNTSTYRLNGILSDILIP